MLSKVKIVVTSEYSKRLMDRVLMIAIGALIPATVHILEDQVRYKLARRNAKRPMGFVNLTSQK